MRRFLRVMLWVAGGLAVLAVAGVLWLRTTPYWAGITLFAEAYRVENFRAMDTVFPYQTVPRAGEVWAFGHDPRPLPARYDFNGESF